MFRIAFLALISIQFSLFAAPLDPLSAAREREERFQTVLLEYRQTNRAIFPESPHKPAFEMKMTFANRLSVDGAKSRFEDNEPVMIGNVQTRFAIDVFDGDIRTTYFPNGLEVGGTPVATIRNATNNSERDLPLLLNSFLRGSAFVSEFKTTGKTEVIEGSSCEIFESIKGEHVRRIWFDRDKNFVPVRLVSERRGTVSSESKCSYQADADWGWVPTGWSSKSFKDGSLWLDHSASVVNLKVNTPLLPDSFKLTFTPGTSVYDESVGNHLIAQADGSLREMTKLERFGPAKVATWQTWLSRNSWYLVIASCFVVFTMLFVDLLSRQRRAELKKA